MDTKRNLPLIIFCYAAIYLVWGSTYFFIAKGVESITPGLLIATRFILSGLVFTIFPIVTGKVKKLPNLKQVGTSIFLGFFLLIMGNGVVTVAEQWVDSYIASLMISTIPLFVAILNRFIYKTKLNIKQILGFFIGFTGVGFLLYSDTPPEGAQQQGIILLFVAVACWGFGTSWSKKLEHHSNTFFSTGMQMLFAGLIGTLVVLIRGEDATLIFRNSSAISIFSLAYLTIIGGATLGAYNYLLKYEPTNRITSYALVNPMIATIIGLIIAKEEPTKFLWIGVPLILFGLIMMLYIGREKKAIS